eukprot:scaffold92995_cov70-Cyclotella_meneghiniana.AAC.1
MDCPSWPNGCGLALDWDRLSSHGRRQNRATSNRTNSCGTLWDWEGRAAAANRILLLALGLG